ncbi:MAG: FTR1 family protein [Chloroflexi bacterium]|nr:FTR1 family protein [Chloroflexota bacterium]
MTAAFLLSLREGLEAALIIGILLGALRQMRRTEFIPAVWIGTISAAAISLITAIVLTRLGLQLEDPGEAIFEGSTMLIAAGLLTWMIFWMSRQARFLKTNLENEIQRASQLGPRAIFFVAFIAVLREGIELALFLAASVFASNSLQTTVGAFLGRLDLRRFFQVTGFLLILFSGGLVARGVYEFIAAGWIPAIIEHVWDINSFLSLDSGLGQLLGTLFGYNPAPSLSEVIVYALYFAAIGFGLRLSGQRSAQEAKAQA